MALNGDANPALVNRALRTIRTELEYLTDASLLTPQQLSSILSQLPSQTPLHAPLLFAAPTNPSPTPLSQISNLSLNEKQTIPYSPVPAQVPPPPAYQQPPVLAIASALYAYIPTDAGDLAISPHDRIIVLEYMNADWWRGKNERSGLEGIFPRSYVTVIEDKSGPLPAPVPQPTSYGNMPLAISQGGSSSTPDLSSKQSKFEENGKKFGKKMGNAAIFGAGATIGSKIVDGIF